MPNNNEKTALLVMDMENGIVSRYADSQDELMPMQKAVETARRHNIQVIFIRVGFSQGYPEVSPHNPAFAKMAEQGGMTLSEEGTQIHASVQPQENEPIVTKHRVSAFAGSSLEMILSAMGIDSLVLAGIATSGVVLSTVREAADKDFSLKVLKDACLDGDPEVHRVLTEKVFPKQADVYSVNEWAGMLD